MVEVISNGKGFHTSEEFAEVLCFASNTLWQYENGNANSHCRVGKMARGNWINVFDRSRFKKMSIILEQKLQFIPPIYVADVDEYDPKHFYWVTKK